MERRAEILSQLGTFDKVFATTQWNLVLTAAREESTAGQDALADLYKSYWYPLYAYVRRLGNSPEDAQDLVQEFFRRTLQGDWLKTVNPERGKFRSWLLACMKHFLANEHDRATALKRGGGTSIVSLESLDGETRYEAEPVTLASPERLFERRWALTLLEQVLRQLEAEWNAQNKSNLFTDLKPALQADSAALSFRDIGARHGMSEGAVKTAAYRIRLRYRDLLRQEIARTVESPEQIDEEIRHLVSVLSES